MRTRIVSLAALLTLFPVICLAEAGRGVSAGPTTPGAATAEKLTVFVHVNLVPMDREAVLPDQTVVVQGGRIAAVGPAAGVAVPAGAAVVDGTGLYLLPGLTDAHIHLDPLVGARPGFGDAPIYLAYGVTTVFNLRGLPQHLDWQRRIQAGTLLAPNLYNSGEFVQEPRVRTPEEAEREVAAQVEAGYDMIKLHQVIDEKTQGYATTTWMELPAYERVNEAAHHAGIPILGHGPYNLGLDAALRSGQSLAHIGEFNPLYFFPVRRTGDYALATVVALLALAAVLGGWGAAAAVRWLRRRPRPERPADLGRVRRLSGFALLAAVLTLAAWIPLVPGGPLFGRVWMLLVLAGLGVVLAALAVAMGFHLAKAWRNGGRSLFSRLAATVATLAVLVLAFTLTYWVPLAWRCADAGIRQVAADCQRAGIWVQTTLVLYDNLIEISDAGTDRVTSTPAFRALPRELQKEWREAGPPLPPWMTVLMHDYPVFTRKLAAALHREGVPMMAGTDAMGVPMVPPGVSLHWELRQLLESGFTPYEALQAATVRPAEFLGKQGEFGTATVGKRADLLLVEGNPLQSFAGLEHPRGVMVRGVWLPEQKLKENLAALQK
jgi:hypothetical protein